MEGAWFWKAPIDVLMQHSSSSIFPSNPKLTAALLLIDIAVPASVVATLVDWTAEVSVLSPLLSTADTAVTVGKSTKV